MEESLILKKKKYSQDIFFRVKKTLSIYYFIKSRNYEKNNITSHQCK